jgi:hypothetical protein
MEGIERFENFGNKKSLKVELSLEGFGCKEVSQNTLHEQKNGTYKIPQTLYDNK